MEEVQESEEVLQQHHLRLLGPVVFFLKGENFIFLVSGEDLLSVVDKSMDNLQIQRSIQ
jgi:GTP cyclohydrolase III